jgi:pimeloyl-ACP methyl ester carboxylesterase
MPDYADCLSSFVNTLGLRQPHVIGLSFGGTLALELYRRHSTVPRSLLIASAYAGWAGSLSPDVAPSDWREFSSSPNCLPSRVDFELAILSPPLERLSKPLLPLSGSYVQVDLVHTVPFEAKRSEQRPPPAEEKPDDETNYRDDDPNHPFGSWFRLVL